MCVCVVVIHEAFQEFLFHRTSIMNARAGHHFHYFSVKSTFPEQSSPGFGVTVEVADAVRGFIKATGTCL